MELADFIDTHHTALHAQEDGTLVLRPASALSLEEQEYAREHRDAIVAKLLHPGGKDRDELVLAPPAVQVLDNLLDGEEERAVQAAEARSAARVERHNLDMMATWSPGKVRRLAQDGKLTPDDVRAWHTAHRALVMRRVRGRMGGVAVATGHVEQIHSDEGRRRW
jgi:hypothetical protein